MKVKHFVLNPFLVLALLIFSILPVKAQTLSNQAEISLLTASAGEELHTLFGHSAIRVKDPAKNIDWVFNYGTFDFRTPNFYLKFLRGKLNYFLAINYFHQFKRSNIAENRSIFEQKLNLDSLAKQKLFSALILNAQEENKFYKYDFLFDNCATRVRDVIEKKTDKKVVFIPPNETKAKTFWNLLDPYLEESRWTYLGIHLALGYPCDKEATHYQYMFLPEPMMEAFSRAQIHQAGKVIPLVQNRECLYEAKPFANPTKWYLSPVFIFSVFALLIFIYTIKMIRSGRPRFWTDSLLFGIMGVLGWIIIFLWFFTDHMAMGPNYSIVWAFPLHFPIALFLLRKKPASWLRYYFVAHFILIVLIIGGWPWLPQTFPMAILPLLAIMAIRSLYIYKQVGLKRR